jgi:hypothetical protein
MCSILTLLQALDIVVVLVEAMCFILTLLQALVIVVVPVEAMCSKKSENRAHGFYQNHNND